MESTIDLTGKIRLRREHEYLNNYNPTILSAVRCNMDIQFLPVATDARKVAFYVSDYAAKKQLCTYDAHAFVAARLAKNAQNDFYKTSKFSAADDEADPKQLAEKQADYKRRAKRNLVSAANALNTWKERSVPQAASHLIGTPDVNTPHKFASLFTTDLLRYIDTVICKDDDGGDYEQPTKSSFVINLAREQTQLIPNLTHYMHCGDSKALAGMCFYDYVSSVVKERIRGGGSGGTPIKFGSGHPLKATYQRLLETKVVPCHYCLQVCVIVSLQSTDDGYLLGSSPLLSVGSTCSAASTTSSGQPCSGR